MFHLCGVRMSKWVFVVFAAQFEAASLAVLNIHVQMMQL